MLPTIHAPGGAEPPRADDEEVVLGEAGELLGSASGHDHAVGGDVGVGEERSSRSCASLRCSSSSVPQS